MTNAETKIVISSFGLVKYFYLILIYEEIVSLLLIKDLY